jgi:hypothetical protein
VQVAFTRSDGPLQAIPHHATANLGYPQSTIDPVVFHACFDRQIRISKRWAKGVDGDTKTAASNGNVALHPVLSECLKDWRTQTPHSKVDDFVFLSLLRFGRVPISSPIFGADYLRPSANGATSQSTSMKSSLRCSFFELHSPRPRSVLLKLLRIELSALDEP